MHLGKYPIISAATKTTPRCGYLLSLKILQYHKYPKLTKLLSQEIKAYLEKSTEYRDGLKALGAFTDTQLDQLSEFGTSGLLEIEVVELDVENKPCSEVNGYTPKGGWKLQLDTDLIDQLEGSSPEDIKANILGVLSTIFHETAHNGVNNNTYQDSPNQYRSGAWERRKEVQKNANGNDVQIWNYYHHGIKVGDETETGAALERGLYFQDYRKESDRTNDSILNEPVNKKCKDGIEDMNKRVKALENAKEFQEKYKDWG